MEALQRERFAFVDIMVEVHSRAIYEEILEVATSAHLVGSCGMEFEAMVNTKYKTVAKKVRPLAIQLPLDTDGHIQQVRKESNVRVTRKIGHKFIEERMAKLKIGGGEFLNEQENENIPRHALQTW